MYFAKYDMPWPAERERGGGGKPTGEKRSVDFFFAEKSIP